MHGHCFDVLLHFHTKLFRISSQQKFHDLFVLAHYPLTAALYLVKEQPPYPVQMQLRVSDKRPYPGPTREFKQTAMHFFVQLKQQVEISAVQRVLQP